VNSAGNKPRRSRFAAIASWCRAERHFLIVAMILAATTIGWNQTIKRLRWVMSKESVPWPTDVRVSDDFRLLNLPKKLGPYVLVKDGEIVYPEDDLELLRVGTSVDKMRLGQRRSNWYLARIYRDTRKSPQARYNAWRLEVYYYTGGMDTVPHVPERCLVAAGAAMLGSKDIIFKAPAARKPWDEPIVFRRARYEVSDRLKLNTRQFVQYYAFSLNGRPEKSWERVRLTLSYPWIRYSYFAKIQFAPVRNVIDQAEADRAAEEFLNNFLPSVLKTLPMPADIERLDSAKSP